MELPNSIATTRRGITLFVTLRLYANRKTHGIATWEKTIEQLLPAMEEAEVSP